MFPAPGGTRCGAGSRPWHCLNYRNLLVLESKGKTQRNPTFLADQCLVSCTFSLGSTQRFLRSLVFATVFSWEMFGWVAGNCWFPVGFLIPKYTIEQSRRSARLVISQHKSEFSLVAFQFSWERHEFVCWLIHVFLQLFTASLARLAQWWVQSTLPRRSTWCRWGSEGWCNH